MARFEDAIMWVMNGARVRRECWAEIVGYTQTTPPLTTVRRWHIWKSPDIEGILQGWGDQVGAVLKSDDPIRDGTIYRASDEDRVADDWMVII